MATSSSMTVHDLPPEMLAQVLSHLSCPEVQRARRVSRHFRNLIDNPQNQVIIFNSRVQSNIQRLADTHKQFISFTFDTTTFIEPLIACLRNRGVQFGIWPRVQNYNCFAHFWLNRLLTEQPIAVPAVDVIEVLLASIACFVVDSYGKLHWPDFETYVPDEFDCKEWTGRLIHIYRRLGIPLDRSEFDPLWEKIHSGELFGPEVLRDDGAVHREGRPWEDGITFVDTTPDYSLTRLAPHAVINKAQERPWAAKWARAQGMCNVEQLQVVLHPGLLAMPECGSFSYCVRDEWAYEQVRKAVVDGRQLNMMTKARVMEQMYIY